MPIFAGISHDSDMSWVKYLPKLLEGQEFDQVWVWLVHNRFSKSFWDWLRSISPKIIALVMESMSYTAPDQALHSDFAKRKANCLEQLENATQVLFVDEVDVAETNLKTPGKAFWWRSCIPERFIVDDVNLSSNSTTAFYGSIYSKREIWLRENALIGKFATPPAPEIAEGLDKRFDQLNYNLFARLQTKDMATHSLLAQHTNAWRALREQIYSCYIQDLKHWRANLNLPSFGSAYTGRVYESMACGIPVISWEIPNRDKTKALFEDGNEILLYRPEQPETLIRHIQYLAQDIEFAQKLATQALIKVKKQFSANVFVKEILDWIGD